MVPFQMPTRSPKLRGWFGSTTRRWFPPGKTATQKYGTSRVPPKESVSPVDLVCVTHFTFVVFSFFFTLIMCCASCKWNTNLESTNLKQTRTEKYAAAAAAAGRKFWPNCTFISSTPLVVISILCMRFCKWRYILLIMHQKILFSFFLLHESCSNSLCFYSE